MPVFALPAALFALAAIPGLVAIYWLRTRSRRVTVSSLTLWVDQRRARQGGTRIDRFQMPLLLILEILAVLLLALAAASPLFLMDADAPTVYVILDDSFSMRAGGGENAARGRAAEAVREELGLDARNPFAKPPYEPRYIIAGQEPRLAETDGGLPDEEQWSCRSPSADIAGAIALAEELSQEGALILVATDEPPAAELKNERLRWRSFGRSEANAAIVNATRSLAEGGRAVSA